MPIECSVCNLARVACDRTTLFTGETQRRRDPKGNKRVKVKTGERRGGRGNHLFSEASVAAGKEHSPERREADAAHGDADPRRIEPITPAPSALSDFDFKSLTNHLRSLRLCGREKKFPKTIPLEPCFNNLRCGKRAGSRFILTTCVSAVNQVVRSRAARDRGPGRCTATRRRGENDGVQANAAALTASASARLPRWPATPRGSAAWSGQRRPPSSPLLAGTGLRTPPRRR